MMTKLSSIDVDAISPPSTWVVEMYSPDSLTGGLGKIEFHFSYNFSDYYVSPDGRIWGQRMGKWSSNWNDFGLPQQLITAAQLWARSDFKALPLYEFLMQTFGVT